LSELSRNEMECSCAR